jgi:hypothetical protein
MQLFVPAAAKEQLSQRIRNVNCVPVGKAAARRGMQLLVPAEAEEQLLVLTAVTAD